MKFRSDMKVELVDFMGGDERVVQAARVSTQGAASQEPQQGVAGLIKFLMRERHRVPFEHSVFTFYIEAPIFVTRQLLKHRISSISEESGRYRELEGEFYLPSADRPLVQVGKTGEYNFEEGDGWQRAVVGVATRTACKEAWQMYRSMLDDSIAKEVARMVLPVNTYSSMYMTLNANSLMNLLSLRNEHHAQYEIREVAVQMEGIFLSRMPLTHASFREVSPL